MNPIPKSDRKRSSRHAVAAVMLYGFLLLASFLFAVLMPGTNPSTAWQGLVPLTLPSSGVLLFCVAFADPSLLAGDLTIPLSVLFFSALINAFAIHHFFRMLETPVSSEASKS